jgi:hypothetical protein
MNKLTKITIALLAIFVIGMTISVAFADPVSAVKYKGKKSMTVTVKDGKKTVKIKCKYSSSAGEYHGEKGKYVVTIWKGPKQSPCYNGWNTVARNIKTYKVSERVGNKKPVTKVRLSFYQ